MTFTPNLKPIFDSTGHHCLWSGFPIAKPLEKIFNPQNARKFFDFQNEVSKVNRIQNTTVKLKDESVQNLMKEPSEKPRQFDFKDLDERVKGSHFDSEKGRLYVRLLCGQILIFEKRREVEELSFKIDKKVTLKQKILKMEVIEGAYKEEFLEIEEDLQAQLESIANSTTMSRSISMVRKKRASSLFKGKKRESEGRGRASGKDSLRANSVLRYVSYFHEIYTLQIYSNASH